MWERVFAMRLGAPLCYAVSVGIRLQSEVSLLTELHKNTGRSCNCPSSLAPGQAAIAVDPPVNWDVWHPISGHGNKNDSASLQGWFVLPFSGARPDLEATLRSSAAFSHIRNRSSRVSPLLEFTLHTNFPSGDFVPPDFFFGSLKQRDHAVLHVTSKKTRQVGSFLHECSFGLLGPNPVTRIDITARFSNLPNSGVSRDVGELCFHKGVTLSLEVEEAEFFYRVDPPLPVVMSGWLSVCSTCAIIFKFLFRNHVTVPYHFTFGQIGRRVLRHGVRMQACTATPGRTPPNSSDNTSDDVMDETRSSQDSALDAEAQADCVEKASSIPLRQISVSSHSSGSSCVSDGTRSRAISRVD